MNADALNNSSETERSISRDIQAIHRDSYGSTVGGAETHVHSNSVVCAVDIDLLPHEVAICGSEEGRDSIRESRRLFQSTIRSSFVAAVEHATGRRVVGFLSETHLDPSFALEYFRLGPA